MVFGLVFLLRFLFLKLPDYPVDQEVKIVGRVTEEPYLTTSNQVIRTEEITIFTNQFPQVFYGDRIEVLGKLKRRVIENAPDKFTLYSDEILVLDRGESSGPWVKMRRGLIGFRYYLEKRIAYILPSPQSSLFSGILLGGRPNFSQKFQKNLRETGTIHLVAASGYNISVVAGALISLFLFFVSRKKALAFSFLGITAYALMAGAGPAVLRAAIMGGLTFTAQFLGKEKEAVRALILTASMMLFVDPLIVFDIGFQLSFGATGGILFVLPKFEKWAFFKTNFFGKEVGLTLAAQIGVLPIILYHFGSISGIFLLVNGLVGPLIPFIMKLGGVAVGITLLSVFLGRFAFFPVWVLLTTMVKLINFFGVVSWGNLTIETFPLWGVVAYYLVLAGVISLIRKKEARYRIFK